MKVGVRDLQVLVWLLFILCGSAVYGQVDVYCTPAYDRFLLYEPFNVRVVIDNRTSREIRVGSGGDAELNFSVKEVGGPHVTKFREEPLPSFLVAAHERTELQINLLRYYDLREVGSYCVRGRLDWMGRSFYSTVSYADVLKGTRIDQLVAEYPPTGQFRTFTLEGIYRNRMGWLFLRVDDEAVCYGVVLMGSVLKLYRPEMMADEEGDVHVLFHSGPNTFERVEVSGAGQIVGREQFAAEQGLPRMGRDGGGDVDVSQEFDDE